MKTANKLLVLKYSSDIVSISDEDNQCLIDRNNIIQHGEQISRLWEQDKNFAIIIISSAARKTLKYNAWSEVLDHWQSAVSRQVRGFLIDDNNFDITAASAINHVLQGGVAVVNGDDYSLGSKSRWRNNDYVACDITSSALKAGLFQWVELGMFSNVNGLLGNVDDSKSVISTVSDISTAKKYVSDCILQNTTGGMSSKIDALHQALQYGANNAWIAHGRVADGLSLARSNKIGTTFRSRVL